MIDLELKKKIANTLSRYEIKCDKLQSQIDTLKNVVNQLFLTPGITYEKDEHFSQLQVQLDAEFDPVLIEKKVTRLVHIIEKLAKKKVNDALKIAELITKCSESLEHLATRSQDKRALAKLQNMLEAGADHQAILQQFNEALTLCVSSVFRALEEKTEEFAAGQDQKEISVKVNDSLQQLLEHLAIPQDLDKKREDIRHSLEQQLNGDNLSRVIDGLTELVVDAFNVEQNRFKGFLKQVTNQLIDFDIFLKTSADNRSESSEDSRKLEFEIQENIEQIKSDIDSSSSIEELSAKINQNLNLIGGRIKDYRDNEQARDEQYQKKVVALQSKLSESEQHAEEIKALLSYQKYKINHDSLTSLPNRESYDEFIIEAIQRWRENKSPISLAIGDIDHFKRINDTFGHLAGDKVLKKVAAIFKSSIRANDYIARFGGEEFVYILEGTPSQEAIIIIEKLRKSIEECQFVYRENKVDVTVSFGLTTILDDDNLESLFMRADNALYAAKNSGRNRSEIL